MPTQLTSPISQTTVLILSPSETIRATLHDILADSGWTVHQASTYIEGLMLLERRKIQVVIVHGKWREMVEAAAALPERPSVIVTVPFADEMLWAEVLNLGGYDVLAQPFDPNEVTRIASAGYRQSQSPACHPYVSAAVAKAG